MTSNRNGCRGGLALFGWVALASTAATPVGAATQSSLTGLYLGAGAGQSTVRGDWAVLGMQSIYDERATGWKLLSGWRATRWLGAELEYTDFGHPAAGGGLGHPEARATAVSGFAVGFVPLPMRGLDVYGKAGLARLDARYRYTPSVCSVCEIVPQAVPLSFRRTQGDLAYGAGAQLQLATAWVVRLEYERIEAAEGDPDLLSVSLSWQLP